MNTFLLNISYGILQSFPRITSCLRADVEIRHPIYHFIVITILIHCS